MVILSNLCYGSSFATLCSQLIVSYFKPTGIRCIIRPWLKHIGFALVYGPLALKTWRYLKNLFVYTSVLNSAFSLVLGYCLDVIQYKL